MVELRCAECGLAAPPDARGWKEQIGDDPCADELPEVVLSCPECWGLEFGGGICA
jgi:hypothetical protein